uniref:exocyst complex component 1-like isoform X2 n=1 Tax=Ciona intestinalis TaxID=7719 RepID=UPI000521A972|nr:exocyst complex component 1-like isoform X2 [Ciona intestinalis]|eukprot:XP_026691670.1 exocyst complex component 1-like isoform X2 [Ciona intestinalis]
MTAIKHALQRDLFTPQDERLLGVVHIGKAGGKKKKAILCASVTTERPVEVFISKIKRAEKGDTYKKQKVWHLKELKVVNGKEIGGKESTEFDLQFEKNFKWSATSVGEKHNFLSCLWKLCHRYLPRQQKPAFSNVPQSILEVSVAGGDTTRGGSTAGVEDDSLEDYQALTEQEETDLERMITECEFAISDAEAFTNSLSKDLSVLDGQNIHSIMGSEAQVNSLMVLLDNALAEVSQIESRLDEYDHMVGGIATQMGQMKNQESFIQITNKNHTRLLEQLDTLVVQLDLSKGHVKALRESDLRTDSGIEACTSAAEALQEAMEVELPKGLSKLNAVKEQQKLFHDLRQKFAARIFEHLNNVFVRQGSDQPGASLAKQASGLKLPKHFPYHRDLLPYRQLILWLKVADKTKYTQLSTTYTQSLNKLYTQEIKDFMATAKQRFIQQAILDVNSGSGSLQSTSRSTLSLAVPMSGEQKSRQKTLSKKLSSSIRNLSGSQQSLSKEKRKIFGSTQSLAVKAVGKKLRFGHKKRTLGGSRESLATSDFELSDREKFSSTFREVLNELEPTCQDEEVFLTKFFHLNVESADTMMPGGSDDEEDDTDQGIASRKKYQEAQVTKEIRRMMTEIFSVVESELLSLVAFGEDLDPLNSLNMLVVIGQRVSQAQQVNDGSFLAKMLGNCLIEVKRNFDNFIKNKVRMVQESHVSKGKKCGILPFVQDFEDFVGLAESIFRDSGRRTDIDKAYSTLIWAVFETIERVSGDSQKTPAEVVMFENYHHLLNCLSSLKIAALENEKKQVRVRYNENFNSYVTTMLGRPLEKLSNFFEGVKQVIDGGLRPEEVGFQLKYSKQELRKCIKEYSGKEVKKGLESVYHKIVKHTSEADHMLLRVVWQDMQKEFIRQYKDFEDLIAKCYAGSQIKLEFTIDDVLNYFSDIALAQ